MGGLTQTQTVVPYLLCMIKHPECVERVVAELSNGTETDAPIQRSDGLVAYRIEYKQGPCKEGCGVLLPDIQKQGCYNRRVDRVGLNNI